MKAFLLTLLSVLSTLLAAAQSFSGTMDRPTLEAYLSRSMTMVGLLDLQQSDPAGYQQEIAMCAQLNARYLGRVGGLWGGEWVLNYNYMSRAQQGVADLRQAYQQAGHEPPIVQAAIFEYVTKKVNEVWMRSETASAFGIAQRQFDYQRMRYTAPPSGTQTDWGTDGLAIVPDMSQLETQMWFYDMATRYIDAGFEAIHFGQVELMDDIDTRHVAWWSLLSRVRAYAASRNRGLVLCDAHTNGLYYDSGRSSRLLFDLHAFPLRMREDRASQAPAGGGTVLDYSGAGCGAPIYGRSLGGLTYFGWSTPSLPFLVEFDNFGITQNPGQRSQSCTPWGWDEITWFSQQTPVYRNQWLKYAYYKVPCLDPNGYLEMPGMRNTMTRQGGGLYRASTGAESAGHYNQQAMIGRLWAGEYDRAWQPSGSAPDAEDNVVRINDNALAYLGPDGRVRVAYRASSSAGQWAVAQPAQLAGLAAGSQMPAYGALAASPDGRYLYYRGTDGEVYGYEIQRLDGAYRYFKLAPRNLGAPEKVQSDLICVGNDRLYYRSANNQIYAYIRCYCGGQEWVPTSPTWVANGTISASNQVLAAGSLVANPAGTALYYRGTDEYIHGFRINNEWSYDYFDLPRNLGDNERVAGQLVCANNNHLYYIGRNQRVFGLILNGAYGEDSSPSYGGRWGRISPSYSASLVPGISLQEQSLCPNLLAASPDGQSLAFRGSDDLVHGFRILDDYNAEYFDTPTMDYMQRPTRSLLFFTNTELAYASSFADHGGNHQLYSHQFSARPPACLNLALNIIEKTYNYSPYVARLAAPDSAAQAPRRAALAPAGLLTAYPSPATSTLHIVLGETSTLTAQVQLTDLTGRLVRGGLLQATGADSPLTGTLAVPDVADGVYLLHTNDGLGNRHTTKVVIQH